jgi:hypothetical protein
MRLVNGGAALISASVIWAMYGLGLVRNINSACTGTKMLLKGRLSRFPDEPITVYLRRLFVPRKPCSFSPSIQLAAT